MNTFCCLIRKMQYQMIKRRYSRYCAIMSGRSQCERSKVYRNSIDYVLLHTFDESQSLGKLHHQRYADSILPIKDKESYRRVTACYSLSITCLKERKKERKKGRKEDVRDKTILLPERRQSSFEESISSEGEGEQVTQENIHNLCKILFPV